jgi:hypothetical protein
VLAVARHGDVDAALRDRVAALAGFTHQVYLAEDRE